MKPGTRMLSAALVPLDWTSPQAFTLYRTFAHQYITVRPRNTLDTSLDAMRLSRRRDLRAGRWAGLHPCTLGR